MIQHRERKEILNDLAEKAAGMAAEIATRAAVEVAHREGLRILDRELFTELIRRYAMAGLDVEAVTVAASDSGVILFPWYLIEKMRIAGQDAATEYIETRGNDDDDNSESDS